MAQRYQRRSEQPQYNPIDIEQSMYPMEALRGAPLPTDPLAGALATARGNPEVMGGPPMTEADFTPQIPASWKEAAVMGGLMAAPVMGQAAWKARGVPKAMIDAAKRGSGDLLMRKIAARDTWYHATSPEGLEGILKEGAIIPAGRSNTALGKKLMAAGTKFEDLPETMQYESGPEVGVSVARTFKHKTKGNQPIVLVLDREKMPPTRPFAESGYGKTRQNRSFYFDDVSQSDIDESHALYKKLQQSTYGTPEWDAASNALKEKSKLADRFGHPNPNFEFENRTYNQPVPLAAVKEIVVHKKPGGRSTRDKTLLPSIREQAVAAGIPVREVPSMRELQQDRVRRTYRGANEAPR